MSEKEIEEMSKDIYSLFRSKTMSRAIASLLYKKGWRKQNGVAVVVRCKDCEHFVESKEAPVTYCNRELKSMWVKPNDFCSYGERRE